MIRLGDWLSELDNPSPLLQTGGDEVEPADVFSQEQVLREQYDEGERRGREAASLEWSAAMVAERERISAEYESRIEEVRREAASVLAGQLQDGLALLRAGIEADVSRVLRPFVSEACRRQAIVEFGKLLSARLESEAADRLSLTIPAPYREPVGQLLIRRGARLAMSDGEDGELRASSPLGGFETRLADWIELIGGGADGLELAPRE